ncbi:MAG: saccharopine dehydrogenase NADP-binding domain-containing protein, partial [Deltaproteobacteria bacterium]|nr:saccharopine dehydrogenase NADP-binding domain-containing protein [Deltaproteobacteria bacterium]
MKRILIIGVGAQGSTIAKRLNEEENVAEIVCADYDLKAAETVGAGLSKGRAAQVNAASVEDIIRVAAGVDIIVNGLPIEYNLNVMAAALEVGACYQDLCMTEIEGKSSEEATR